MRIVGTVVAADDGGGDDGDEAVGWPSNELDDDDERYAVVVRGGDGNDGCRCYCCCRGADCKSDNAEARYPDSICLRSEKTYDRPKYRRFDLTGLVVDKASRYITIYESLFTFRDIPSTPKSHNSNSIGFFGFSLHVTSLHSTLILNGRNIIASRIYHCIFS